MLCWPSAPAKNQEDRAMHRAYIIVYWQNDNWNMSDNKITIVQFFKKPYLLEKWEGWSLFQQKKCTNVED